MSSKHTGSSFEKYMLDVLSSDDELCLQHICEATNNPHITGEDYAYFFKAVHDIAIVKGWIDRNETEKNVPQHQFRSKP